MDNQPKLNSSKEVIAFLAERFPHCFSAEGEARPLNFGRFTDEDEQGLRQLVAQLEKVLATTDYKKFFASVAG